MFTIYNHGQSKTVPVNGNNVFLARHQVLTTDDKDLAQALSGLHEISVQSEHKETRQGLMKKAKEAGLKVSFKDTRDDLIQKLKHKERGNA